MFYFVLVHFVLVLKSIISQLFLARDLKHLLIIAYSLQIAGYNRMYWSNEPTIIWIPVCSFDQIVAYYMLYIIVITVNVFLIYYYCFTCN